MSTNEMNGDSETMILTAEDWEELNLKACSPLLSRMWFESCVLALCPPQTTKFIVKKSEGLASAVAPLGLIGKRRPRMEILGTSVIGEPGGFLYSSGEALSGLLEEVVQLRIPLFLKGLRIASPEARFLENMIRSKRVRAFVREERIPWVAVNGTWTEFEKQISPSRRSSFRRLQRLAEGKGKLEFEAVTPSGPDLEKYFREVLAVESAGWKGRKRTAISSEPRLRKFFEEYCRRAAAEGKLRLFFLRIGGKAVAVAITTVHSNRLWISKIGYDEEWAWCSPGILMMHRLVENCFESGLDGCEFLGSDEPWLHIWADESHSLATYRIYPRSVKGAFDMAVDSLEMVINKITTVLSTRRAHRRAPAHA